MVISTSSDKRFGLCYLRVPSWCLFRLPLYFNGHNWLASQLQANGIAYQLTDNAFTAPADFPCAQHLADSWKVSTLHRALDQFATEYCPGLKTLGVPSPWSLMQVEEATDILFTSRDALTDLYQFLSHTAIQAVKATDGATFLGRKLTGRYDGPLGTSFSTRLEGIRLTHHMGPVSLTLL